MAWTRPDWTAVTSIAFQAYPTTLLAFGLWNRLLTRYPAAAVTPFALLLQFISGVFFQFSEIPTWMQTFASLFPLKWMAQGLRSVFLPSSFGLTFCVDNAESSIRVTAARSTGTSCSPTRSRSSGAG